MNETPFQELTIEQIKRIMDLCQEIREENRRKNPNGFYSTDDCMGYVPSEREEELYRLYASLSKVARWELIALKEFGKRGFVRAHHWKTDLKFAKLQLGDPNILDGDEVGLHLQQGLRNLTKTSLLPGMPV